MNPLLMKLLSVYMAPEGEGSSGGGTADRGDNLDGDKKPEGEAGEEGAGKEGESSGGTEADAKKEDGEDGDDKQGRDEKTGRFTKKERDEQHIPKARFDEAVGKERSAREAAERRAAELEAQVAREEKSADIAAKEAEIEKLEEQHAKLLIDGEKEKATEVMKKIRHSEREIARLESDAKVSSATSRAVEQVRVEAVIARLEADHPMMNEKSEDYNPRVVNLVLAEQRRLISEERLTPAKALQQAADTIIELVTPKKTDDGDSKGGLSAAQKSADRKSEQVKRNIDTSQRQPASMKDAGKDSDKAGEGKVDVANLTQAEFAALPDSTKARLRGDFV